MKDFTIPSELIDQFAAGNGVIWLGAGASIGSGLPSWEGLIKSMSQQLVNEQEISESDLDELTFLDIAQLFKHFGEHYYYTFLRNEISGRSRSTISSAENKTLVAVADLVNHFWPQPGISVVSTNYDTLLEDYLLSNHGKKARKIISANDIATLDTKKELTVLKPNGDIDTPDSIVLTLEDYCEYRFRKPQFVSALENLFAKSTVLFIGYGLNDFTFNSMLGEVRASLFPLKRRAFMLAKGASMAKTRVLSALGVDVIGISDFDDIPTILRAVTLQQTTIERAIRKIDEFPDPVRQSFSKSTLLLVEDDKRLVESVENIFQHHHWDGLVSCSNPEDALKRIKTLPFDYILTDLAMPRVSGEQIVTTARHSKQNKRSIIAFWSGYDDDGKCLAYGADYFFTKPIDIDVIIEVLYRLKRLRDGNY